MSDSPFSGEVGKVLRGKWRAIVAYDGAKDTILAKVLLQSVSDRFRSCSSQLCDFEEFQEVTDNK